MMPIYNYLCVDCGAEDRRVAGLDDRVANCVECGGVMFRTDPDLFEPYFTPEEEIAPPQA